MGVNNVDLLALKEASHLNNSNWIDLESNPERRVPPAQILQLIVERLAFECHELNVVPRILLSLRQGHHAVNRTVHQVRCASDVGDIQLFLFTHAC